VPGDYYLLPKKTNHECVLEPYRYTVAAAEVLITSLAVPIRNGGPRDLGVAGADLSLQSLADEITHLKVGETVMRRWCPMPATTSPILTPRATASRWSTRSVGEAVSGRHPARRGIHCESFSHTLNDNTFRIAVPFQVGEATTPWSSIVTIPEGEVLASPSGCATP